MIRAPSLKPLTFLPQPATIPLSSTAGSYCALLTVPVVALFFLLGGLLNWAHAAASTLFY